MESVTGVKRRDFEAREAPRVSEAQSKGSCWIGVDSHPHS